jgi:hypothetical protein
MSTRIVRILLLGLPTLVLVLWGVLSRRTELPLLPGVAAVAAVVLALGSAAHPSIAMRRLVKPAAISGVISGVVGYPLAILAMIFEPGMGHVTIGYAGWPGVSPALVWSMSALIMATGGALVSVAAVMLGHWTRARFGNRTAEP